MRKLMIPLVLVATFGAAGAALAADTSGTITNVNPTRHTVTLSDGYTYTFVTVDPRDYDGDPLAAWRNDAWRKKLNSFKVGDEVSIHYTNVGTAREALAISPVN